MAEPFPHLFEPLKIKDLTLPNRIVMAPVGNNLAESDGSFSERGLAYYLARARGGAGMIITEAVSVNRLGRHRPAALSLFNPLHEDRLLTFTESIHRSECKLCIQLNHTGRMADPEICGGRIVSASAIPAREGAHVPEAMSRAEIEDTIADFARAARTAVKLGFDAIEIHGAHGYLLHQFFSPRSNQRSDDLGGDLEARMRFPLRVAEAVLGAVRETLPVMYRLSAEELAPGGYSIQDSLAFGRALRALGVDVLDISAGTVDDVEAFAYVIQPADLPEGCLIKYADGFRRKVGPPVIGVGRIVRPALADQLLSEVKLDLVALGRALVADPEWPNKARGLNTEPLRTCIACKHCTERVGNRQPIRCSVNPVAGQEDHARRDSPHS